MPTEIKNELDSTLGGSSPSSSTVMKWAAQCRRDRLSVFDDERSVRDRGDIANISVDCVLNIVHEHLHIKHTFEFANVGRSQTHSNERFFGKSFSAR